MEEDFYNYLRDSNNIGLFNYGNKSKVMINKIPYNNKIDILYSLDSYGGNLFDLKTPFKYAGIYDKDNDKVYDLDYSIRWHLLNWDYQNDQYIGASNLYETINEEINIRIEELIVDGKNDMFNIDDFELVELEDDDVIDEFMDGKRSDTLKDEIKKYSSKKPKNILEYLTNKKTFIEEETRDFILDNMQDIMEGLVRSEEKRNKLKEIEENPKHPYHKVRDIINAVTEKNCKTVVVTVSKDDIEQTFSYDANSLTCYNASYLSTFNIIKLSDREKFEEKFGRYSDFSFKDIIKITYGRNTIYEDKNFKKMDLEDEDILGRSK